MVNLFGPPVLAPSADGRLELFVLGWDENLWHIWQTARSNGWSGWDSRGGPFDGTFISPPALMASADGRIEVFVSGDALWHIYQTARSNGWSDWDSRGLPLTPGDSLGSAPSMGQNADARLEVFAVGGDGALWHISQTAPSNGWSDWASLGQPPGVFFVSQPAVAPSGDSRLELFVVGSDGNLWHMWQTAINDGWSGWVNFGNAGVGFASESPSISSPRLAPSQDGRLELFLVGNDGALWHIWQTGWSNGWSGWFSHGSMGGGFLDSPAVAPSADDRLEVFVVAQDGELYHMWQTAVSNGWSGLVSQGNAGVGFNSSPALGRSADCRLELFIVGRDGNLWHSWQTSQSNGWADWVSLGQP